MSRKRTRAGRKAFRDVCGQVKEQEGAAADYLAMKVELESGEVVASPLDEVSGRLKVTNANCLLQLRSCGVTWVYLSAKLNAKQWLYGQCGCLVQMGPRRWMPPGRI